MSDNPNITGASWKQKIKSRAFIFSVGVFIVATIRIFQGDVQNIGSDLQGYAWAVAIAAAYSVGSKYTELKHGPAPVAAPPAQPNVEVNVDYGTE